MTQKKKLTAGAWMALVTFVLIVASVVVYSMNISSAGYFQNASVSNLMLFSILSACCLALAVVLSMVKAQGAASKCVSLLCGALQIAAPVLLCVCLMNLASARVEGLGFIYFSNADVALEVQTAENLSSATTAIVSMVCFGVSILFGMVTAFFNLKKD